MFERKQILLWGGLTLAVLLGTLWQFVPLTDAKHRIETLPPFAWVRRTRHPALHGEQGYFKNVNVLKRVYRVGKQTLFVSALDGTDNRHVVHDPLYSFRGSGWQVVSQ